MFCWRSFDSGFRFFQVFSGVSGQIRSGLFDSVRGRSANAGRILSGSACSPPVFDGSGRAPAMLDCSLISCSERSVLFGLVRTRSVGGVQVLAGLVGCGNARDGQLSGGATPVCPLTSSDEASRLCSACTGPSYAHMGACAVARVQQLRAANAVRQVWGFDYRTATSCSASSRARCAWARAISAQAPV